MPEPLEPNGENIVVYEWIKMPDSSGFGDYTESGLVIPCKLNGEDVSYVSQMYLDDEALIAAGREIWVSKEIRPPQTATRQGHADRHASLCRSTGRDGHDGLWATPRWRAAPNAPKPPSPRRRSTSKIIPGVHGDLEICQLVALNIEDITIKPHGAVQAPLHRPDVHAPVADLPVRRIIGATHFIADLTLPYGRVAHDYLARR